MVIFAATVHQQTFRIPLTNIYVCLLEYFLGFCGLYSLKVEMFGTFTLSYVQKAYKTYSLFSKGVTITDSDL